MTDRELLEMIVSDIGDIKSDVAGLKSDVTELKSDVAELKSKVSDLDSRVTSLESGMINLKANFDRLEADVADLKAVQMRTTAAVEGTVDKCIQVLYECHTLSAERLDKFDIEKIKINSDIAATVAKMAYDEVMRKVS